MRMTIPTLRGAPLLGNLVPFLRDPVGLCQRAYEEVGPVFRLRLAGRNLVVLAGPEYHEAFYAATDDGLSMFEPAKPIRIVSGDIGFSPDTETHGRMRQALTPIYSNQVLGKNATLMRAEVREAIDALGAEGEIEVNDFFWHLTLNISVRYLLGDELRTTRMDDIRRLYRTVVDGLSWFIPPRLPIPRHIRRDRALRELRGLLGEALDRELRCGRNSGGVVRQFAELSRQPPWTLEETCSLLLFLVMGSHDTTSSLAAWSVLTSVEHPEFATRLRRRLEAHDEESFEFHPDFDMYIKEVERLHSTFQFTIRYARKKVEIGPYTVPKGWNVALCPQVSHLVPEVYPDPHRFDPERFSAERDEGRGHKYPFVGFGGGTHACLGRAAAMLEVKIILSELLRRVEFAFGDPPQVDPGHITRRPRSPFRLRYRRR